MLTCADNSCIVSYRIVSEESRTCIGLWTKLRLFGHGDAEPGLEAAEEMLKRGEQMR